MWKWRTRCNHVSTDTPPDAKPLPCRICGGRAGVEHITEEPQMAPQVGFAGLEWAMLPMAPPARRYAQVICRICDTRGPRVLFLAGDEWPHVQAEQIALSKWAWMHRER